MKTRVSFVSNSSSSSFIVVGRPPYGCKFHELTKEQVSKLSDDPKLSHHLPKDYAQCVWLTEYFSDGAETEVEDWEDLFVLHYDDGDHGGPYAPDKFILISPPSRDMERLMTSLGCPSGYGNGVWLQKKHTASGKEFTLCEND